MWHSGRRPRTWELTAAAEPEAGVAEAAPGSCRPQEGDGCGVGGQNGKEIVGGGRLWEGIEGGGGGGGKGWGGGQNGLLEVVGVGDGERGGGGS